MSYRLDLSKEYGVVLEGGGAKGAYQIGALKALKELNVAIKSVVGTSVGALNGVLVVQDELDKAIDLWQHIKYSRIINVEDELLEKVAKWDFKDLDLKKIFNKFKKIIMDGGVDITPLKKLIASVVDEEKVRNAGTEFGLVTVSLSDRKPLELFIEDIEEGRLHDFLLASSYLPVFKHEKLHGKSYVDGGFYNNSPMSMLIEKGHKDIIIIKIQGLGFDKKADLKDINVFEIAPSENLGGLLEFDNNKVNYNLNLGYYDTIRRVKGLKGYNYYISVDKDEDYYIDKIIHMSHDSKTKCCELFNIKNKSVNRALVEDVIPRIAKKLGLKYTWDYTGLVIGVLEYFGKKFEMEKFTEYTYEDYLEQINEALQKKSKSIEKEEEIIMELIIKELA